MALSISLMALSINLKMRYWRYQRVLWLWIMMKRKKVDGNVYRFFGSNIVGQAVAITKSEQDDTLLWHKWLGYRGERGIREL